MGAIQKQVFGRQGGEKVNCIIYNKKKEILRTIKCPPALREKQLRKNEFIMEGEANDATQKIEFDGFDERGQPINPRVVNKTPKEIQAGKSPEVLFEKRAANITNEQWRDVLHRIDKLEKK
jgi:hypothetical protein